MVFIEYVWIDGQGGMRSKTRNEINLTSDSTISQVRPWNFDGSQTYQATESNSEIILKPIRLFDDPFRKFPHKLVLCETCNPDMTPTTYNKRKDAVSKFDQKPETNPWYGLECEFYLMKTEDTYVSTTPIAKTKDGSYNSARDYYCGTGSKSIWGRDIVEAIVNACKYAGINIASFNAEAGPSQWKYTVGICNGIEIADHVWMSRYIAHRVSELYGAQININPKPRDADKGSAMNINYSNKAMRTNNSKDYLINTIIPKLQATHNECMAVYGADNDKRLGDKYSSFTYGVADRTASVRIPSMTGQYFEDRRPGANIDPYTVASLLFDIIELR